MQGAILKSFTYEDKGGNGAGVILLDKQISNEKKQETAAKIGLSETAFILQKDEANFDVSFFTPVCEVDLCGHATIAAFYYLGLLNIINGFNEIKKVYQNTKAGKLEIEVKFNGKVDYVMMQQQEPQIFDELIGQDLINIAQSLNTSENNIGLMDFKIFPTIVSTGLKDIMVPVKSRNILNSLNVKLNEINDISIEKDVVGYHVYTVENGKIYARNFAPRVGINEECATGTSNGALCSLLYNKKLISQESRVIQGESMNEKSLIYVKIVDKDDSVDVRVGGISSIIKDLII
ncbi:MAG: PhzF family phenazine biosynthesis protein [Sedimentibacter sp.]